MARASTLARRPKPKARGRAAAAGRRRPPAPPRPPAPAGWWGSGLAPWLRWPGVTIELSATWSKARERWESLDGRFYFDAEAAARAAEFFPRFLRHHKGEFAGQAFELLDYQRELVILPLFGWKRASDGLRRFRKVFLEVPKGNGKSPLGAGLALYLLLADGEEGAEVYSAAADRDQARIVFDTARVMVEADPILRDLCEVYRGSIVVASTRSSYKVLSADAGTKHGFNIHGLVFDEFHAQPSRELYETLMRGLVKRRQPVLFLVTTAGDDEESICYEEYDYARRVQSGTIPDETFLPVIFEAESGADWTLPETWRRVNPGFGVTVKADALEAECQAAQNEPRKRNDFMRYHLDRWVAQATAWIPVEWWDACNVGQLEDAQLAQLPVAAGLDLAQKTDLAAFVLTFRHSRPAPALKVDAPQPGDLEVVGPEGERRSIALDFDVSWLPFFWLPEETLAQREREDGIPYSLWAEQGLLTPTPGAVIDYDRIFDDVLKLTARFPRLREGQLGYDPAFATQLALQLLDAGLLVVEVLQNYKHLSEACQVFEALVKGRRIRHDGHRLMRWNVENVAIRQDDAGRIRPVKPKSRKRIDGVVAGIMGLQRLMLLRETPNVYEERGLTIL